MNICSVCKKAGKKKKIDETTGLLVCSVCRKNEGWARRDEKNRKQKVELQFILTNETFKCMVS